MKNRTPPMKRIKDQKYYLENVDIEAEIMKKAIAIAERMVASMLREKMHRPLAEVEVDLDELADKIAVRISALPIARGYTQVTGEELKEKVDDFAFDDDQAIITTEDYDITGDIVKRSKTNDDTKDALDALMDLEL